LREGVPFLRSLFQNSDFGDDKEGFDKLYLALTYFTYIPISMFKVGSKSGRALIGFQPIAVPPVTQPLFAINGVVTSNCERN
jgi:hypothetical protein